MSSAPVPVLVYTYFAWITMLPPPMTVVGSSSAVSNASIRLS